MKFVGALIFVLTFLVSCEDPAVEGPIIDKTDHSRLFVRNKCTKDIHCFVVNDVCGCYANLSRVFHEKELERLSDANQWEFIAQKENTQSFSSENTHIFASSDPKACSNQEDSKTFVSRESFESIRSSYEVRCSDYYESVCAKNSECILRIK